MNATLECSYSKADNCDQSFGNKTLRVLRIPNVRNRHVQLLFLKHFKNLEVLELKNYSEAILESIGQLQVSSQLLIIRDWYTYPWLLWTSYMFLFILSEKFDEFESGGCTWRRRILCSISRWPSHSWYKYISSSKLSTISDKYFYFANEHFFFHIWNTLSTVLFIFVDVESLDLRFVGGVGVVFNCDLVPPSVKYLRICVPTSSKVRERKLVELKKMFIDANSSKFQDLPPGFRTHLYSSFFTFIDEKKNPEKFIISIEE